MSDAPIPSTADLLYQDRQNFDMPQFQLQQTPQIQAQFAPQTVFNLPTSNFVPPPTVGPLINNAPPPVATAPQQFQQPFVPAPSQAGSWYQQPPLTGSFPSGLVPPASHSPGFDMWSPAPDNGIPGTDPDTGKPVLFADPFASIVDPNQSVVAPGADNAMTAYQLAAPQAGVDPKFVPPELPGGPQDFVGSVSELDGPAIYKGTPLTESFSTLKNIVEEINPGPKPRYEYDPKVGGYVHGTSGPKVTAENERNLGLLANAVATGNIDDSLIRDLNIPANTLVEAHHRYVGVRDAEMLRFDTPALPPSADALAATVGTVSADDAMRAVPSTPGGLSAAPKDDPAVRLVEELYTAGVEAAGTPLSDEAKKDLYTRTVDRVKVDEVYKPRLAAIEERLGGLDKEDPSYDVLAKEKERLETRIGAIEEKYKPLLHQSTKKPSTRLSF